jgi:hypothetical protein
MQTVTLGEAFNRRDSLLTDGSHRRDARSAGTSIDQDRAGAALAFSAAVLASRQIKLIAQHAEQTDVRTCVNGAGASIYIQIRNLSHAKTSSSEE